MISQQFPFIKQSNHPLTEMLRDLHHAKIPYDSDPAEIQEVIKSFSIPSIEKTSISKANELILEGKNEKTVLYAISLSFLFDSQKFLEYEMVLNKCGATKSLVVVGYYFIFSWIVSRDPMHLNFYFDLLNVADKLKKLISEEIYCFIINIVTLKYSTEGKEEIPLKVIQNYFKNCTKENVYTIVDILDKSIQSNNKSTINFLLHKMTVSFEKNIEQFKSIDFSRLIKIISPILYKFDPSVLAMLAVLTKMTKQTELLDSFRELPSQTFLQISDTRIYEYKEPTIGKLENVGNECLFDISYEENGEEVSEEMIKIPNFDTTSTIQDLILPSHKYVIAAIAPIIVEVPEEYSTSFLESFSDIVATSSDRFDLFIDYISLVTHPSKSEMTSKIFDRIACHRVFSSETLFFGPKNDDFIVRSSIVSNFAVYNHPALESLLKLLEDTPFMYAEVIGIVSTKLPLIKNISFINHESIGSMMRALDILARLLKLKPNLKVQIQNARKTIFLFIFSILEDQTTAYICLSSITFATGFFSRVFENEMKDLILQSFSKVLISVDIEHKEDLRPSIEFIGALLKMSKDQKLTEILQCINNASMINNSLPIIFMPMMESVCTFLNNTPSIEFLKQTLDFFLQAYLCIPQFSMSQNQIRIISCAIQLLNGEEPCESTVTTILGMLALSRSVRMPSMMILRRPELILLFLSVFATKESTNNALVFIYDLCKHSIRNRIICSLGELDLLLLEAVKNYPNSFVFRSLYFNLKFDEQDIDNLILKIVTLISSDISNPQVASKFISLATPVGNKYPKFAINAFTAISRCVSYISSTPSPKMPIGTDDEEIFIHGITGDKIKNGFTVMFWLNVDVPCSQTINTHPLIFSFLDEGNAAIKVFLTGSSLILKVLTTKGVSSALLTATLPSCKWSHITLVFRPSERQTAFDYILNCSRPATFMISNPKFTDSELEVKIGGVYDGMKEESNCLSHGVEISKLCLYDKVFDFKNEISPYCSGVGRKLSVDPLFTYPKVDIDKNFTLLDAFISNYRNLLPFFTYIETMPPHFITLFIDIHKVMISASLNVDFCFISYLLQQNDPSVLTYSLWNKFFGYLEFFSSDQKIAKDLMTYILASAELWHNAPPKELLRVLNSWPSLINFGLFELVSFRTILSYLRIYFYFKPVETELIIPRKDETNVKVYVQAILNVLRQHKMTEFDMIAIISHCASCPDTEQVISILSLFSQPTEYLSIPRLLFYLLKPRKEDIFVATLRAIKNLTGEMFPLFVEAITCVLKPFYCTSLLFDKLLELLKDIPMIYPLCFIVAYNLSDFSQKVPSEAQIVVTAIESVALTPNMVKKSEYWIVWLALLASKLDETYQVHLVSFAGTILLDNFNIEVFNRSLTLIEIVSNAKNIDLTFFESELTKLIVDLNSSNDEQLRTRLFKICTRILLIRNNQKVISRQLFDIYKDSPFYDRHTSRARLSGNFLPIRSPKRQCSAYELPKIDGRDSPLALSNELSLSQAGFLTTSELSIETGSLTFSHSPPISPVFPDASNVGENDGEDEYENDEESITMSQLNFFTNSRLAKIARNSSILRFSPQRRKNSIHEQKSGLGVVPDLLYDIKNISSRKYRFCLNAEENLLQTTLLLSKTISQLTPADHAIVDFLEHVKDRNAKPMTQDLYSALYNYVDQFVNDNNNAYLFKSMRSKLISHWEDVETKALNYSQLISSQVASIASGDVDNQLESINYLLSYMAKEWQELRMKVMVKSTPWESQAGKILFKKRFTCCGMFNQPFIKSVPQNLGETPEEPSIKTNCTVVKIDKQTRAIFTIQSDSFSLKKQSINKVYRYVNMQYILLRCPGQKPTAFEVFFDSGKTIFLDFAPHTVIDTLQKLAKNAPQAIVQTTTNFASFFKKTGTTQMWIDGEITNFEYLMRINMFCGRSFRHPALYPIFPWIVIDFSNAHMNFEQIEMLRDLNYPITAQTPKQRKNLREKINDGDCMYFTSPSNPTQVAHWLVRMEPFTTLHLDSEGGHFGCNDRLFLSMKRTTHQVLESANCWECIPEFYCFPEFLLDLNKTGLKDVELPVWSESAFDFVYHQREALESEISSKFLNNWIDLIFGVYLKKDCDEHFNAYNEFLHEDVWEQQGEENPDRCFIEAMLEKSGQLPPVVFSENHPTKAPKAKQDSKNNFSSVSFDRPPILESVLVSSNSLLVYEVIFENGTIETLSIDPENPSSSKGTTLRKLEKIPDVIRKTKDGLFVMDNLTAKTGKMILSDGTETTLSQLPELSLAESSKSAVIGVTNKGTIVNLINKKDLCIVLSDKITLLSYSAKFKLVLCLTPSDEIMAFSTHDQYLYTIDLKGSTPSKILITESWGFIVVCCGRKLKLYDVNGFFIREREMNFDIAEWTTWSDNKGFDHIAICDHNGVVFAFEVFYLSPESALSHCQKPIASINYVKSISSLVLITKDSRCLFVSYPNN